MPTAEAARVRLRELGSSDPAQDPNTSHAVQADLKASQQELKAWTVCI